MDKKQIYEKYDKILQRAETMGIAKDDRITHLMDIESADEKFHLRLDDWLNADDFNFAHDFWGIRDNISRTEFPSSNFGTFVPRFATPVQK